MIVELEEIWDAMKNSSYKNTVKCIKNDVSSSLTVCEAIEKALKVIIESSHAVAGTFWYYDRFYDNLIYPKATIGGSKLDGISIKVGEGFAGETILKGESITVFDCQNDERFASNIDDKTGFITKTMMCVPLKVANSCFGCIQIINKTDNLLFDEKDLAFVEDLANFLTNLMFKKGMLNNFVFDEEEKNKIIEKNTLNVNNFEKFVTQVRQSDNFISLSYDRQKKILKDLDNIKKELQYKK